MIYSNSKPEQEKNATYTTHNEILKQSKKHHVSVKKKKSRKYKHNDNAQWQCIT